MLKKLILVMLSVVLIFNCVGCGASGPQGVAENFVKKTVNNDTDGAIGLCENNEDGTILVGMLKLGLSMTQDRKFKLEAADQEDEKVSYNVEGDSGHLCRIDLEKIDGKWVVTGLY